MFPDHNIQKHLLLPVYDSKLGTPVTLTEREYTALKLIREGCNKTEISGYLHVPEKVIEKQKENLMKKFKFKRASDLKYFPFLDFIPEKSS